MVTSVSVVMFLTILYVLQNFNKSTELSNWSTDLAALARPTQTSRFLTTPVSLLFIIVLLINLDLSPWLFMVPKIRITKVLMIQYKTLHCLGQTKHSFLDSVEPTQSRSNVYHQNQSINEDQVDILEHSFGKLVQRAGKVNVTWEIIHGKPGDKSVAYLQPVDDGTCRYQCICNVDVPYKNLCKYMLKDNYLEKIFTRVTKSQFLPAEIINERMKILHIMTPSGVFMGKREGVWYNWDLELDTVAYRVQTSLESDDKTFLQKDMDPNTTKMFAQPGTGFVLKKINKTQSQIIMCNHVDIGGTVTKYGFQNTIAKYMVPQILPKIFNMEKYHKYQRFD